MSFEDRALLEQVPHLRRFAISLLRNRDRADDLVQDCLVRALSKKKSFQAGTNLRSWLFTILHNLFVDGQRRKNGRPIPAAEQWAMDRLAVDPQQGNSVLLKELGEAIAELPSAQRFLLLLVTIEGFSYEEAAAVARIPVGTVRSRLSRARGALRDRLALGSPGEAIELNGKWKKPDQRSRTECTA